jgi:hypothetical protein
MKTLFTLGLACLLVPRVQAQLVAKARCAVFTIEILDGKLNGLKPSVPYAELKAKLPCFTATVPEGDSSRCGGAVYFADKDVTFYTDRDYIEVGQKFDGKMSLPIMGASRNSLFSTLGNPKVKDDDWDAFETAYGCLVLHYNKSGKVNLIQFSSTGINTLHLCNSK